MSADLTLTPGFDDPRFGLSSDELERDADYHTRRIPNFHDREDARQEYRIAAWRALEQADPARDPKAYQRVSGRNAVKAFCRRESRRMRAVSLETPCGDGEAGRVESLYSFVDAKGPNPAEEVAAEDLVRNLRSVISKLPPHLRRITEMQIEGLSTKDICKRLGFTRQAINRSKSRAQVLMRRRFEKVGSTQTTTDSSPETSPVAIEPDDSTDAA